MRSPAALDEVSPRLPSPVGRMAQLQLRTAKSAVDVHGVASPFVIGTCAMQAMDDSPEAHAHIVGQVMSQLKVGLRTLEMALQQQHDDGVTQVARRRYERAARGDST